MSDINDFVTVNITIESSVVSAVGFGTELILGDSDVLPSVDVVTLTNDAALVASNVYGAKLNGTALAGAGLTWASDNDTTMAAIAAIIQARPEVATAVASDVGTVGYDNTITVTSDTDEVLTFTEVEITLGSSQATVTVVKTQALTRTRVYTSLSGVAVDFAVTDLEYLKAQKTFSQDPRPPSLKIGRKNAGGETWVEALDAIELADNDWYGLSVTTRTPADILLIAAWIETRTKIFGLASNDAGILAATTTDIAEDLQALGYTRTFTVYHQDADNSITDLMPEDAWFGRMLPKAPGSATWAFKVLTGVTVSTLTATQIANALGKNCNLYELVAGRNMTHEGVVASGQFIDVIVGVDWLESRMTERIFGRLASSDKIPYTDDGINMVAAEVRAQLDAAIDQAVITPGYTITQPAAADISAGTKETRDLSGVTFEATLQGAIHNITVVGTVSF